MDTKPAVEPAAQTAPVEKVVLPNWVVGVMGALIAAVVVGTFSQMWSANSQSAAVQERLKTLEARVDDLKTVAGVVPTIQERLKTLEAKIDELKTVPSQITAVTSVVNVAAGEIAKLREDWTQAQAMIQKHEAENGSNSAEITTVRSTALDQAESITKLRERVAALEAVMGQKPAAPGK
jgi:chromosome segregation ATPase